MANTLFRFIVSHRLFSSVRWTYPSACHHNVLLEKSNSIVVRNVTSTEGLASLDPSESKPTKTHLPISTPKPSVLYMTLAQRVHLQ